MPSGAGPGDKEKVKRTVRNNTHQIQYTGQIADDGVPKTEQCSSNKLMHISVVCRAARE